MHYEGKHTWVEKGLTASLGTMCRHSVQRVPVWRFSHFLMSQTG
jgi:hypothetical protein